MVSEEAPAFELVRFGFHMFEKELTSLSECPLPTPGSNPSRRDEITRLLPPDGDGFCQNRPLGLTTDQP